MKLKIKVDGEIIPFLYEHLLDGGIYVNTNQHQIKKNTKKFDLNDDFSTNNTRISKRDDTVILTRKEADESKTQFLINSDSNYDECPLELQPIIKHAFDIAQQKTLADLMEFAKKNIKK